MTIILQKINIFNIKNIISINFNTHMDNEHQRSILSFVYYKETMLANVIDRKEK